MKILIEKSDLDHMAVFKCQHGDEMHKILTVVRSLSSHGFAAACAQTSFL